MKLALLFAIGFAGGGFATCVATLLRLLADGRLPTPADARFAAGAALAARCPSLDESDEATHAWLQHQVPALTAQAATLLVAGPDRRLNARIARLLAGQIARSGLNTFLIADGADIRCPDPGSGLSDVLDKSVHPRDAIVGLEDHLGWLPIGAADRVADQSASGKIEVLLRELAGHCEALVVCLPHADPVVQTRAASAVDAVVFVVDPGDRHGRSGAEVVRTFGRPVAAAVVASLPEAR